MLDELKESSDSERLRLRTIVSNLGLFDIKVREANDYGVGRRNG